MSNRISKGYHQKTWNSGNFSKNERRNIQASERKFDNRFTTTNGAPSGKRRIKRNAINIKNNTKLDTPSKILAYVMLGTTCAELVTAKFPPVAIKQQTKTATTILQQGTNMVKHSSEQNRNTKSIANSFNQTTSLNNTNSSLVEQQNVNTNTTNQTFNSGSNQIFNSQNISTSLHPSNLTSTFSKNLESSSNASSRSGLYETSPQKSISKATEKIYEPIQKHVEKIQEELSKRGGLSVPLQKLQKVLNRLQSSQNFTVGHLQSHLNSTNSSIIKNKIFEAIDLPITDTINNAMGSLVNGYSFNPNDRGIITAIRDASREIFKGIYNDNRGYILEIAKPLCEAAQNNLLSIDLIKEMAEHMDKTIQSGAVPSNVRDIHQFLHKLTDEQNFQTFNESVVQFKNDASKQLDCIYNILISPYQRNWEGSCFGSAILKVCKENMPQAWVKFISEIVSNNTANFNYFVTGNETVRPDLIIDVSKIGNNDSIADKTYQKAISGIASFDIGDSRGGVKTKILNILIEQKQGKDQKPLFTPEEAQSIAEELSKNIVYTHGIWTPEANITGNVQMVQDLVETSIKNLKRADGIIKNLLNQRVVKALSKAAAEAIVQGRAPSGGNPISIIKALDPNNKLDRDDVNDSSIFELKQPGTGAANAYISTENMDKIFHILNTIPSGHSIVGGYELLAESGHIMTFEGGPYKSVRKMKDQEKIKVGDLNYLDNSEVFVKKINKNYVQFVKANDEPIEAKELQYLTLYPKFGIDPNNFVPEQHDQGWMDKVKRFMPQLKK